MKRVVLMPFVIAAVVLVALAMYVEGVPYGLDREFEAVVAAMHLDADVERYFVVLADGDARDEVARVLRQRGRSARLGVVVR